MLTRSMTIRPKRNIIKKEYNEDIMIKNHITLTNNSKSIKKVKKNSNKNKKLIKNIERNLDENVKIFCKVFSKIVEKICSEFIHHDDSANDISATGYERKFEYERGFKLIYKPQDLYSRGGGWVEWADIELVVPEDINISEEQEKEIYKEINYIYSLMIKDFNIILKKSKNRWYDKLIHKDYDQDESEVNWIPDQNKILVIEIPFRRINTNVWSVRYYLCDECFYYWNPISVIKYGNDLKIKKIKDEFQIFSDEYKDREDVYEYIEEYEVPKKYIDSDYLKEILDDGYRCEYAVLSE